MTLKRRDAGKATAREHACIVHRPRALRALRCVTGVRTHLSPVSAPAPFINLQSNKAQLFT